jgi:hypothetical protein
MAFFECLPTHLNPLAERTCFSQVEKVFDSKMEASFGARRYNSFMDMSVGVWVSSLTEYTQRLAAAGAGFLALSHKDDAGTQLYSVLVHGPHTQVSPRR